MTLQAPISAPAAELPLYLVDEINHRVVNEHAAISFLSRAAARGSADDGAAARAQAAERLRAHAETHRALPQPADGQVNLADRRVHRTFDSDESWLSSARAWRIGLAVAELVRNAARHGLRGRDGATTVRLTEHEGHILGGVGDNGGGPAALRPGRGSGLVRALAAELRDWADWRFGPAGCMVQMHSPSVRSDGALKP